jgi:hypothetical protein
MTPINAYETESARDRRWFLAGLGGLAAAFIGAVIWAIVTVTAKAQIGWMAVGVGLLVGLAVRLAKGGRAFAVLGACLALFGCVLGNFLSLVAFAAGEQHITMLTALGNVDYARAASVLWDDFLSTSILFYAIAAYEGYRFSAVRKKASFAIQEKIN